MLRLAALALVTLAMPAWAETVMVAKPLQKPEQDKPVIKFEYAYPTPDQADKQSLPVGLTVGGPVIKYIPAD